MIYVVSTPFGPILATAELPQAVNLAIDSGARVSRHMLGVPAREPDIIYENGRWHDDDSCDSFEKTVQELRRQAGR